MVCLYGPTVALLPADVQMVLWQGRQRAKNHKQAINWDTNQPMSKEAFESVYTDLIGSERALNIVSIMDRKDKEAEADRRLREG